MKQNGYLENMCLIFSLLEREASGGVNLRDINMFLEGNTTALPVIHSPRVLKLDENSSQFVTQSLTLA